MANEADKWKPQVPQALLDKEKEVDEQFKKEEEPKLTVHNPDLEKEPEEPEEEPEVIEEDYQTKYKVLQNKFDSQDRNQKREISDLRLQISTLQGTIQNLNDLLLQTRQERPKETEKEPNRENPDLTTEEFEGYGPEMLKLVSVVNSLKKENTDLRSKVGKVDSLGEVVNRTETTSFNDKITTLCNDWAVINEMPEFIQWLGSAKAVLQGHYDSRDAVKVAGFFNDWKRLTGWGKDKGEKGALEEQVVPESSATTPPSQKKTLKKVTQAEYDKAFDDLRNKRITEAEFDKVLMAYQRTIQENRRR